MSDNIKLDLLGDGDTDCEVSDRKHDADLSQDVGGINTKSLAVGHTEPLVSFRRKIRSSQDSENSDWSGSTPAGQVLEKPRRPLSKSSIIPRKRLKLQRFSGDRDSSSLKSISESHQSILTQIIPGGFQPKLGRRQHFVSSSSAIILWPLSSSLVSRALRINYSTT